MKYSRARTSLLESLVLAVVLTGSLSIECVIGQTSSVTSLSVADQSGLTQDYFVQQSEKLKAHWTCVLEYPKEPATIRFTIQKDGTIGAVNIASSSTNHEFDSLCQFAVKNSAPFQQLPVGLELLNCEAHFGRVRSSPFICKSDVEYNQYMEDLQRRVKRAWLPPRVGYSSALIVGFTVHASGEITNLKVVRSTGDALQDYRAFSAVQDASLQPLPIGAPPTVDVEITLDHNVSDSQPAGTTDKDR
jgi:TonB family protein